VFDARSTQLSQATILKALFAADGKTFEYRSLTVFSASSRVAPGFDAI
jgi:hypothetical protein